MTPEDSERWYHPSLAPFHVVAALSLLVGDVEADRAGEVTKKYIERGTWLPPGVSCVALSSP